ncbi:hypothetical protein AGMMS50276_27200 [Synergistales bacterium]|nr:hypothetical protein AGMMS50276_27200 [Synergistales bacterium]
MCGAVFAPLAAFAIDYVNADGTPGTDPGAASASQISSSSGTLTLTTGWYYVSGNVTASSGIVINGNVKIILTDGYALITTGAIRQAGIVVTAGNTLTIYGQSGGTGSLTATGGNDSAGIGGNDSAVIGGSGSGSGGNINIISGKVTANGGGIGAGIGGGYGGSGGNITISGGTVTANGGGSRGAGIGGGGHGNSGGSGGNITISGGTVTANGNGAGIGGGYGLGGYGGDGGTINITGGIVTANGGSRGAGIGGGSGAGDSSGYGGSGDTITITGGIVTANGGDRSAGIGGGSGVGPGSTAGGGGTITISGQAIVKATRGTNAPYDIGPGTGGNGNGNPATVTITGGSVEATNNAISNTPTNGSNTLYRVTYPPTGTATGSFSLAVTGAPDYPFTMPSSGTAYLWLPTPMNIIEIINAIADGSPGVETSTLISLDFAPAIAVTLSDSNITITNGTGAATKGVTVIRDGAQQSIALDSVATEGEVLVTVNPPVGYALLLPNELSVDVYKKSVNGTVATPTASPAGGIYLSAQTVTLSTVTTGADIYYTLNGNTPTSGDTLYSAPITVPVNTTLKAIAVKPNMTDSAVMEEVYTDNFIPVTNITDVPTLTPERTPLILSGTIEPQDATYKTIVWSVLNAGATGATVSGDTLNTTLAGTVNVLATITNGLENLPEPLDYIQSFDITVRPLTASELIAESIRDNSGLDAIASGDVITVSGDQVGASTLTIDTTQSPGARIQWNASYKGSLPLPLVIVRGNGVIELGVGANISNTMGSALTSEGDIIISGAVIEANGDYATAVFSEKNISMSSGSVSANGMDGMALFAAGDITLTGGSLSATGERGLAVHALGTLRVNDSVLITPSQAIKAEGGIVHIDSGKGGGGCGVGFGVGAIALALCLMARARKK